MKTKTDEELLNLVERLYKTLDYYDERGICDPDVASLLNEAEKCIEQYKVKDPDDADDEWFEQVRVANICNLS